MARYNGTTQDWRVKGARFVRYLTTRSVECWGFLAVGVLIGKIIL